MKKPSKLLLAWAGGWFEGEGTIVIRRRGHVQLQAASIDEETPKKFAAIVGGKVYGPYGPYQPNRKPHWRWDAYGNTAGDVLRLLFPYLGARRRAKAIEALERLNHVQDANIPTRS